MIICALNVYPLKKYHSYYDVNCLLNAFSCDNESSIISPIIIVV